METDVIKLTEFIENYLFHYEISRNGYQNEYGDDDERVSGIFPDGKLDEVKIAEVLEYTGLTRKEWFSLNEDTLNKFDRKYPFFRLDRKFQNLYESNSRFIEPFAHRGSSWDKEMFREGHFVGPARYDVERIRRRIVELSALMWELDDIQDYEDEDDLSMAFVNLEQEEAEERRDFECVQDISEDTIPLNRFSHYSDIYDDRDVEERPEPVGIKYTTETAFSFPQYRHMISSLFRTIQRYKELFIITLKSDLSAEEIDDMNFLATALDVRDVVCNGFLLNYRMVRSLRGVYLKEHLKDFLSYVKFGILEDRKYWACYEFAQDQKSAEMLIHLCPSALPRMREYIMLAGHFSCWFFWSNAVPPFREREEDEDEEDWEDEKKDWLRDGFLSPEYEPRYRNNMPQHVHIYVDKDESDYLGDESHFDSLRDMIRSEKQGGLPLPIRECSGEILPLPDGTTFDRRAARENALAQAGGVSS